MPLLNCWWCAFEGSGGWSNVAPMPRGPCQTQGPLRHRGSEEAFPTHFHNKMASDPFKVIVGPPYPWLFGVGATPLERRKYRRLLTLFVASYKFEVQCKYPVFQNPLPGNDENSADYSLFSSLFSSQCATQFSSLCDLVVAGGCRGFACRGRTPLVQER